MKVLSLFDGISGARQALKNLNIDCEYYASEIDKYAIQVSKNNHLDIIHIGDVNDIDFKQIKDVDLLIAGFPCQDLSIAKRDGKGLEGARSGLFSKCLEALEICKPKYFLFENVNSMKKEWRDKISKLLGVEPIMINSALLTAQMRKRLYWTNIPNIQQPEDKGIVLKDIIESGDTERLKSYCITATYSRACPEDYFNHGQRQLIFKKPIRVGHFNKGGQGDRIYSVDGKSVCLSANGGGRGAKTGLYEFKANNGKRVEVDLLKDFYAFREVRTEEGKRKRAEFRKLTGLDSTKRGPGDKKFIPKNDGKANCLTTGLGIEGVIKIKEMVRKLTPIECARLQGYPDLYCSGISNSQAYKCYGNSFTVPVIEHLLKHIN